jgi:acyl-CoA dehydrogenase
MGLLWFGLFLVVFSVLSYHRASLKVWTFSLVTFFVIMSRLSTITFWHMTFAWLCFLAIIIPLHATQWRQRNITRHLLNKYRKIMPTMSRTEREALAAGTVGWEGDLFRGNPDWDKLLHFEKPTLSEEEQAFINGPLEKLCSMIDDWDITHNRADLPPEMWQFIKDNGFFGLIIPKEFGGKQFSAYAHSQILVKIYSLSASVATTVAVPNSLGPAELLLHYGTDEQKNYYLPRLARGDEIPCFALTGPEAGSDAGAMSDTGIVCWGEHEGQKVLGMRLNWDKRYITLAPVATVIGLAFKMYDPDHLLGDKVELGITCALIPRGTHGMTIGRRHFPVNAAFQNGPIQGKDVFIPLDWIIGGSKMAGYGWKMLMECLAAGRAISLPSSSTGGAKSLAYASGAYARVRKQFGTPIGRFEGIEEVLARIAGNVYIMDATRSFSAAMIDRGEKPAVASAITKYHVTELGRMVGNDGMDLHGGKGICLGPRNYLGRGYEAIPIAITVEGANILTRSMIIFGQGAMRCHPYIFAELEAAKIKDEAERLAEFDKVLMGHMSFTVSNIVRSFVLGLTNGYFVRAPQGKTKRYFQQATRLSSAFALIADMSLMLLGGSLKRKESISGRLGDILSQLFLLSSVLKHYRDQGKNGEDLPLVRWAGLTCLYQIQQRLDELLKNYPNRWVGYLLRVLIFPLGKHFSPPSDKLNHKVAQLLLVPEGTRERLSHGAYLTADGTNMMGFLQDALLKAVAVEPIEKIIKLANQDGLISKGLFMEQATAALKMNIITQDQFDLLVESEKARSIVIAVDDFDSEELMHHTSKNEKHGSYANKESTHQ